MVTGRHGVRDKACAGRLIYVNYLNLRPSEKLEPSFWFLHRRPKLAYQVAADVRLVHRRSAAWTR